MDGTETIPGKGTAVPARASERDGSTQPGHRLWTGPGEDDGELTFRVQYGHLTLEADLAAKAKKGQPTAMETKRGRSTLRAGQSGPVLASVEYGFYGCSAENGHALERLKTGKRWPLGMDHWTNFVVFSPLELGGAPVAPGDYSLVLEGAKGHDAWLLALIASDDCRKAFTNPHHAEKLEAAVRAPITREEPTRLVFHCGPNRWIASVARGQ